MSFGRQSGPPASARQMDYLRSLVEKAGHTGFRDARGPLGLSQRQAGGKFTKAEASALIDRLVDGGGGDGDTSDGAAAEYRSAAERLEAEQAGVLRGMPAGLLAAELERRGWTVTSPF
ncbi:MAG: hypothetical protein JXA83_03115 [Acidimicrobiales bacterium]|nr:hypothetical protein [Acidimicrobiales bacterium]